ncbi:MAG: DegT/DnrJ/EryC1/StrS family aminotransferase [Victivallales bacterium]|nr:DegT/DnrJ/EryC1/StrS family aminotransferase [Victivallales bacterium]
MRVPLVDLCRNFSKYSNNYESILLKVSSSCQFIMGSELCRFEENFAEYLGVKHVLGVGSGTDALTLLLKACGAAGKLVLTQNNTFTATTLAIANAGGRIALCDIDPATYQLDLDSYDGPGPDIILPVHLYGYPCDVEKIRAKFGPQVTIIEDACQAHGSQLNGRCCGSLGRGAGFSFYPGKNLGAFGDGGAVATDDDGIADEIRALRNWGGSKKYIHDRPGGNSRLDNIQAAILDFKLKHLDEWNRRRNAHAELYRELLRDCPEIVLPAQTPAGSRQNYHLFVIRFRTVSRDRVLSKLHEKEIFAGIHYPLTINKQLVYKDEPFARKTFPVSEERSGQILSLPMFPELSEAEIKFIAAALREIVAQEN